MVGRKRYSGAITKGADESKKELVCGVAHDARARMNPGARHRRLVSNAHIKGLLFPAHCNRTSSYSSDGGGASLVLFFVVDDAEEEAIISRS
jgi:hypothetical protein